MIGVTIKAMLIKYSYAMFNGTCETMRKGIQSL